MAVKTHTSEDGATLTIKLSGRFDINDFTPFSKAYKEHPGAVSQYIIDMAELEYMDSSALGMMLMLREYAVTTKAEITITNASPAIGKILQVANFNKLFTIH